MDDHTDLVDPVTRVLHDAEEALASNPQLGETLLAIARAARWGDAAARLTMSIQPPIGIDRARQLVADEARRATGARAVTIGTREQEPVGAVSAEPGETEHFRILTRAVSTMVPYRVEEVLERSIEDLHAVLVPMPAHLAGRGAIIAWYDAPPAPFQLLDRDHLAAFAEQAALSLDRARAIEDRADLAVVSDRERIARDLHDVVIQRLFATGLQLEAVRGSLSDPAAAAQLEAAMDALDLTVRDIRQTVFELEHGGAGSLRAEVRDLIREYVGPLGHTPVLRTNGPVDTGVSDRVHRSLVSVLGEALSHISRHSRAGSTEISVAVTGEQVVLTVSDDGIDSDEYREAELADARRRAEALGGSFEVSPRMPRGTVVRWAVPSAR